MLAKAQKTKFRRSQIGRRRCSLLNFDVRPQMRRLCFAVVLLAFCASATAAIDCEKAISTIDINECASIEQKQVEVRLNAVYQRVIKSLEHPDNEVERYSEMKASLIAAQRAWVKFREADCHAV